MRAKVRGIVIFALVVLAIWLGGYLNSVWAQEGAQTPSMKVERIVIEGNKHVPKAEILAALPFKVGDVVTVEEIKAGGQRILDLGYFQRVQPDYKQVDTGIEVTYEVTENPVVREIEVKGNKQYGGPINLFGLKIPFTSPILKTDRIIEILKDHGVEKGKVLNVKKLKEGLQAILDEYQKKGYVLVSIGDVKLGPTLTIQIIEGEIEQIEVTGVSERLKKIAQDAIRIPLNKPVKAGAFQATLQRLNGLIFFEKTNLSDITFMPGSAPDKLRLVWNLRERRLLDEPSAIKKIEFQDATVYSPAQLEQLLGPLPEGEIDNFQLLELLQKIYELYHENGYTLMDLSNEGIADGTLKIRVLEGIVNDIIIQGNERTKEYVIRRRLTIHPGEVYNENVLQESYRNLQKLGYFRDIGFQFEPIAPGKVNLIITIQEKKNLGSFNGALSYTKGGLVGKLTLSWKNIFGTGQDISIGYDRSLTGASQVNWHLDYSTLTFFPNYDYFKISLYQKTEEGREEEQQYTLHKSGLQASLEYPLGRNTELTLGQRYENSYKCFAGECKPPATTSSITITLSNDDRDDINFPTEGGVRQLGLEQAGAFSPGPRFIKLTFSLAQYFPSFKKDQSIAVRLYGGQGFSLPSHERFKFGGTTTLRGFKPSPTGKFALLNAEYRAKLTEGAIGVVFLDLGVAEGIGIERSIGLELRAQIPSVGPIRIIFSWPFVEGQLNWQPKIDFSFGTMF